MSDKTKYSILDIEDSVNNLKGLAAMVDHFGLRLNELIGEEDEADVFAVMLIRDQIEAEAVRLKRIMDGLAQERKVAK
ncbi:hypothetical protein [Hydrogenimonas urashimensis]|uniref:hypothetical protein n=1 Tax=Hydrogenimonas urashimensis TaxID=2740515 RepID=UPI00191517D3|nr:hypothetical protein [Hydrogenimonas urashimensis]